MHCEDVRRPLGIRRDYPSTTLTRVAEYCQGSGLVVLAKGSIRGLRLLATDGLFTTRLRAARARHRRGGDAG